MHSLITGAGGFVGEALADRIVATLAPGDTLSLIDLSIRADMAGDQVRQFAGTLTDRDLLSDAVGDRVDVVYHLATLPGIGAEQDFEAGREANLDATIALLETLRLRSPACRLVAASSAAVYGAPVPSHVDDDTYPQPSLSYAAHKMVSEILINDYTRRGYIDGLALRLSGILARPPGSAVNLSAFFNDVIFAARAATPFVMPVSRETRTWFMSRPCCVDNLLHAGALPAGRLPARRNWALPTLRVGMGELVEALARRYGDRVRDLISFAPRPEMDAIFNQPPLEAPMAAALGFRADASIDALLDAALACAA